MTSNQKHSLRYREFNELALHRNTTNNHLKIITKCLLEYFSPMKALSNKKRAMRLAMRKPCDVSFKRFAARIMKINKFLHLFPVSDPTKNIPTE